MLRLNKSTCQSSTCRLQGSWTCAEPLQHPLRCRKKGLRGSDRIAILSPPSASSPASSSSPARRWIRQQPKKCSACYLHCASPTLFCSLRAPLSIPSPCWSSGRGYGLIKQQRHLSSMSLRVNWCGLFKSRREDARQSIGSTAFITYLKDVRSTHTPEAIFNINL